MTEETIYNEKNNRNEVIKFIEKALVLLSIILLLISFVLFIGALIGYRPLVEKDMPFLLIGKRRTTIIWVYPMDFFYLLAFPGILVLIYKKLPVFLHSISGAGFLLILVLLHKIIDEFGPWYIDFADDIEGLLGIATVVIFVIWSYYSIKEYIKRQKNNDE